MATIPATDVEPGQIVSYRHFGPATVLDIEHVQHATHGIAVRIHYRVHGSTHIANTVIPARSLVTVHRLPTEVLHPSVVGKVLKDFPRAKGYSAWGYREDGIIIKAEKNGDVVVMATGNPAQQMEMLTGCAHVARDAGLVIRREPQIVGNAYSTLVLGRA